MVAIAGRRCGRFVVFPSWKYFTRLRTLLAPMHRFQFTCSSLLRTFAARIPRQEIFIAHSRTSADLKSIVPHYFRLNPCIHTRIPCCIIMTRTPDISQKKMALHREFSFKVLSFCIYSEQERMGKEIGPRIPSMSASPLLTIWERKHHQSSGLHPLI